MPMWDIKGRDALSSTSGATGVLDASWMQGDFAVNYGAGGSASGGTPGIPSWVWIAAVALAGVYVWKHRRR